LRLAKYLAEAGIASRRKAEEFIVQGRVKVNGLLVQEKGYIINPDLDRVEFDGRIITREEKVYILLNKPAGYISSVFDPQGRPTVMDLLKDITLRVYPVGRFSTGQN
jgi:16S rRNA U516 pseudouridylate synthase RsuA-like enzyme